jgi:protein-S-isoprenylcysteine O-methyltransferase Ste14
MNNLMSWISLPCLGLIVFNLAGFALGIGVLGNSRLKTRFFAAPKLAQKSLVGWMVLPVWLLAFLPQPRAAFVPIPVAWITGGLLTAAALVTWVLALARIGVIPSIRARDGLVTTGIYGLVRNPIYLGNILSAFGPALVMQAGYGLLYAPVVLLLYLRLVLVEERDLRLQYGAAYEQYQGKVPYRLVPYVL